MGWLDTLQQTFLDWPSMLAVLPNMVTIGLKNTLILAVCSTVIGALIGLVLSALAPGF
jgi:ABC-type amino acid transport system permease subunit